MGLRAPHVLVKMARPLLIPGMAAQEAAAALLSHTWRAGDVVDDNGGWERQPGRMTRMHDDIWGASTSGARQPHLTQTAFQSHRMAVLPDTKGGARIDSVVHEFTLDATSAEHVNAALRVRGESEYMSGREGVGKSSVGGYHSEVEMFRATRTDAWYRHVHDVVLAALSVVEPGWRSAGEGVGECTADIAGWLNASRRLDYNIIHGHDGCVWSCVYYVDDGSTADPKTTAPFNFTRSRKKRDREESPGTLPPLSDDETSGLLGALLLRTRPDPLVPAFEFTPLTSSPGRLLIFPAHLQHAVMPRALRRPPVPLSAPPWALSLRISIAMNAYRPNTFTPGAFVVGGVLVN